MAEKATAEAKLAEIAAEARSYLETVWPESHRLRGRPLPDPLSFGTCQTSSLFLTEMLKERGFEARVEQGNDPAREEGYFHDGRWHGHAWVECGGRILDLTADQFGLPALHIATPDDQHYRRGADTAYESAKQQRRALVAAALDAWRSRF